MSRVVWKRLNLVVPAGAAKPSPAIGQAMGGVGVNMMNFCKDVNARTQHFEPNIPIRCQFTAFRDSTYQFEVKAPRTSWFLKKAAGLDKAAAKPGWEVAGSVHIKQIYELAKLKQAEDPGLAKLSTENVVKCMVGQCSSMGLTVRK